MPRTKFEGEDTNDKVLSLGIASTVDAYFATRTPPIISTPGPSANNVCEG